MSRSNEHIHGSRRLHRVLGLGLSGAALAGLIYFEGMSARAEVEEADGVEEAEVEALYVEDLEDLEVAVLDAEDVVENVVPTANPAVLPPSGAVVPVEPAAGGPVALATVAAHAEAVQMPVAPPVPVLVAVPDIEGMSLRKAKKQLAAVGLKLSVRDEYGWKIPREYWSDYKVRSQKIDAGVEVEAGSTVKVKARMKASAAMGY